MVARVAKFGIRFEAANRARLLGPAEDERRLGTRDRGPCSAMSVSTRPSRCLYSWRWLVLQNSVSRRKRNGPIVFPQNWQPTQILVSILGVLVVSIIANPQ